MSKRPLIFILLTLISGTLQAAPTSDGLAFFEKKVRPLLVQHCQECHAAAKHKGGLRLDNLPYIMQGGELGPALVPHKPEESLIIKAVDYADKDLQMPPSSKLPAADIATLRQWIAMGAPWPEAEVASAKPARKPGQITDEDRQWWAFRPLDTSKAGALIQQGEAFARQTGKADAVRNPIDAFVLATLQDKNLRPAPEATPAELIRRLSFDLTGLPPTPQEVEHFVAECRQEAAGSKPGKPAYERLVDRLLASPRYGERQAQHWLDLVRYAESEGYRLDSYRPNVWPYRDYVIAAFNNDKPYDRFMREQIAGDEIAPDDLQAQVATAFLRLTIYEYNQRDAEGQWKLIMNEATDVTADVFLGMSVQCAQCHDHKFDPILQKDYYRLQSFIGNITWPENKQLCTAEEKQRHEGQLKAWEAATTGPRAVIDGIIEPRIAKAQKSAMEKFPEEVQAMWRKPREQRTPYEEQIVQLAWRQADYERVRFKPEKLKEADAAKLKEAEEALVPFESLKPKPLMTGFVIGETGPVGRNAAFKTRRAGTIEAAPGFLTILDPSDATIPVRESNASTSGRRTVLADWLARPDNPLTPRVMVNRTWQHLFAKGLAANPSDFGRLGEKPSHPELLDWLTRQFIDHGWSLKWLSKQIVMSATYRQSAMMLAGKDGQSAKLADPDDRLLWRYPPRRLDAEQSRDAALAASGELDLTMGGEGVPASKPRRSIYTKKIRNTQDPVLASLDAPAGFQSIPERQATTTATQSLLLINGDWALDRARALASRLLKEKPAGDGGLVDRAFALAYGRRPSAEEARAAMDFLKKQRSQLQREAPPAPKLPVGTEPLADARSVMGETPANAAKTTRTIVFKPGSPHEKIRVPTTAPEPEAFALEAIVKLDSLYPDAGVRTIISRWNNGKTDTGWSFGVTSEKSAHKPNNLILQLSGEDFQGSQLYEAIPSGLRIPLDKPYYVAASVDPHPASGQQFGCSVTFYARDLSDPAAALQTATVASQVCGGWINADRTLYLGGRDVDKRSLWDGSIARAAIRKAPLDPGKLMTWASRSDPTCLADLTADDASTMLNPKTPAHWSWESSAAPVKASSGKLDPTKEAVADLCHALLNSNEFFYLQ